MGGGIEENLMVVLTVQIDEAAADFAKRGGGRKGAVDERAAPPLCGDLAADDHFPAVDGLENGFNGSQVLARTDEVGRSAPSDQEADGADQDALARPRLTRQDGEAGAELQLEAVDDCKMLDAQEAEHGPEVPSYQMFDSL